MIFVVSSQHPVPVPLILVLRSLPGQSIWPELMWLRVLMLLSVTVPSWVLWLIVVLTVALLVRIVGSLLAPQIALLTSKVWIDIS